MQQEQDAGAASSSSISWTAWCGIVLGIGVAVAAAQRNDLLDSAAMGCAAGSVTWVVLEFALWFYRNLAYILFGGSTAGLALGAAVGTNRHCLEPVTPDAFKEQAVCLALSVFAPELAPMTEVRLGLVPVESTGQRSLELPESSDPDRAWLEHLSWPRLNRQALAAPELEEDTDAGLSQVDPVERGRFNTCVTRLYEEPALNYKSWAIAKFNISVEDAHDAVMDALVGVCENFMTSQIREL